MERERPRAGVSRLLTDVTARRTVRVVEPDLYIPLLSVLIASLGGMFRGFAGFGGGLLMAPLMTLLHPPAVVIPALLTLALLGDVRLLPEVRRDVIPRRVLLVTVPALFGIPLGIAALATLNPEVVRRTVNVIVLAAACLLWRGVAIARADRARVLVPVGLVGGVLTGIGGLGGTPVALTFLSLKEAAATTRANLIGYFSLTNASAIVMMLVGGVLGARSATLAALCAVPYFVMIHVGSGRFRGTSDAAYRRVALAFLATVATVGLLAPAYHS